MLTFIARIYTGIYSKRGKKRRNMNNIVVENINITLYVISSEKYYKY